jgi:hypothetical protein
MTSDDPDRGNLFSTVWTKWTVVDYHDQDAPMIDYWEHGQFRQVEL